MTKKELISKLEELPDDAEMGINGYEGGYSLLGSITPIKIIRDDLHSCYCGEYENADCSFIEPTESNPKKDLYILH